MSTKFKLLCSNPKKYLPLAVKLTISLPQRVLAYLSSRSAFPIQAQMDINPKSVWHDKDFIKASGGFFPPSDNQTRNIVSLEPWDNVRRDMILLLLRKLITDNISGDIAELGVYKGFTAKLLHHYMPERNLHLFDTFSGFDQRDIDSEINNTGLAESSLHFSNTTVKTVLNNIKPQNDNVHIHEGFFPDSIPSSMKETTFAFIHLDADLYAPTKSGLEFFYNKLSKGGFILVHDYNAWPGPRKAVDEFVKANNTIAIPMPDKNGSALIIKE